MRYLLSTLLVVGCLWSFAQQSSTHYKSHHNGNLTSGGVQTSGNVKTKGLIRWNEGKVQSSTTYINKSVVCVQEDTGTVSVFDRHLSNIKIYPNPFTFKIAIDAGNTDISQVRILNMEGAVLYQNSEIDKAKVSVDLEDLTAGVYFLYLKTEKGVYTQRIVKM